jgi:hypothetical protein
MTERTKDHSGKAFSSEQMRSGAANRHPGAAYPSKGAFVLSAYFLGVPAAGVFPFRDLM